MLKKAFSFVLAFLLCASTSFAGIAATSNWEIETGGATTNGAAFDPGMAGMLTDLAATSGNTAAPVVSSASYNFVAGDVGHWVFIQSGTNWIPGWYKIASVASNQATLTATAGQGILYSSYVLSTANGVATVASPTAGTWAVDYTQKTTSALSNTDFATSGIGVTTVTTATGGLGKQMIGNALHLNSGTNVTAGFYFITAVASGTSMTVDRAPDNGVGGVSAGNGKIGGAHSDPALVCASAVGGNFLWLQSGTFTITSASTNVAGGCLIPPAGTTAAKTSVIGYGTLRADNGTKPLLQASAISTFALVKFATNANCFLSNISMDGASLTSAKGVDGFSNSATESVIYRCKFAHFTGWATKTGTSSITILCEATACSTNTAFASGIYYFCCAHDNSFYGFHFSDSGNLAYGCLSINNTGASGYGFVFNGTGNVSQSCCNCTSFGNAQAGFYVITVPQGHDTWVNCLSYGNTGNGFDAAASAGGTSAINCAGGGNAANFGTNIPTANQLNFTALTANPFMNSAGGDFSLNTAVGGGLALRTAGIPGTSALTAMPGVSTNNYLDLGAFQHKDPPHVPKQGVILPFTKPKIVTLKKAG